MEQATTVNEAAIWDRMIQPISKKLPPDAAKFFLDLGFADSDLQRMQYLADKNRDAELTLQESEELRRYRMVGMQVDLLRSISRRSVADE